MTRYVAFLRAINVRGHPLIAMPGAGIRSSGHEPELEHGKEAARPRYALIAFGSWCCSAARRPRGKSMPSVLIL